MFHAEKTKALLALVVFLIVLGLVGEMESSAGSQSFRVEEDTPFFDCTTMGNYRCGPGWPFDLREQK